MASLEYSNDAINILDMFHKVNYIVYVEGADDICFWELILEKYSDLKFEIQDVGGCEQLKEYMDNIISGDLNVIVATDFDFNFFSDEAVLHKRILRTYGYSIENTFISYITVKKVIKALGKLKDKELTDINISGWLEETHKVMSDLIKLDIYNHIFKCGNCVVGDTAHKFLENKSSISLSADLIQTYMEEIISSIEEYDVSIINDILRKKRTETKRWVKGHFLFSVVANYIRRVLKRLGKKISISDSSLYASFILIYESELNRNNVENNYYKEIVSNVS